MLKAGLISYEKTPCGIQLEFAGVFLFSGESKWQKSPIFYRFVFTAASTKPLNNGCGLLGLDFSSG